MIAGPILLVLALDRGPTFAGDAAAGTLLGIVAVIAFVLAYVAVSRRFAWPAALVIGWAAFLVAVAALRPVHVGAPIAFALACAACGTTLRLLPDPGVTGATAPHPRWDLPLRAVCAVIPVVAVTGAARLLGPHLSGLPAAFPVITPVLAAFTHAQQGPREVARLLHGFTVGFFAYALFCLAVSTGLDRLGVGSAFVLATALALVAQASAIVVTRRREQLVAAMEA